MKAGNKMRYNLKLIFTLLALSLLTNCGANKKQEDKKELGEILKKRENIVFVLLNSEHIGILPDLKDRQEFYVTTPSQRKSLVTRLSLKYPELSREQIKSRFICVADVVYGKADGDPDYKKKAYSHVKKCVEKFAAILDEEGELIDRIVGGTGEENIERASILRSEFNVKIGLQKEEAKTFYDKEAMKKRFIKNNQGENAIPTAKFAHFDLKNIKGGFSEGEIKEIIIARLSKEFDSDVKSFILKPTDSARSTGVKKFLNYDDRDQLVSDIINYINEISFERAFLIEEFIEGNIYRFDGVMKNGKMFYLTTTKYLVPEMLHYQKGVTSMNIKVDDPDLNHKAWSFAEKALQNLNYENGPFHLEGILRVKEGGTTKEGDFYFLETAIRPGGPNLKGIAAEDYNPAKDFIWSQLGIDIPMVQMNKNYRIIVFRSPTVIDVLIDEGEKIETVNFDGRLGFKYLGNTIEPTINFKYMILNSNDLVWERERVRPGSVIHTVAFSCCLGDKEAKEEMNEEVFRVYKESNIYLRVRSDETLSNGKSIYNKDVQLEEGHWVLK